MKEWLKAETPEDTKNFYETKYAKDGIDAFRCNDWNELFFHQIVHFFYELRPTDLILDCGCGSGHFLKSIVEKYPERHPYLCGIEISPAAANLAHAYLKGHAAIALGDYMSEESFKPNTFDIVTCWGTIEHSPNIQAAFERIVDYAKPGGLVMITFPLEFDGCMDHIQNEENKKNNERFATEEEWREMVSKWLNPFHVSKVGNDLLMVFRKWVSA